MSLTSTYAPLKSRTLPMVLPPDLAPSHDVRRWHITPPAGYALASMPRTGEVRHPSFGHARLEVKTLGGGKVQVLREFSLDEHQIEPQNYPAFRQFLQSADSLLRQSVRFEKAGTR